MKSIPQFPNEIIEAILLHLPVAYSNESVRTICRVGLANSRFLAVSRSPHVWKPHYESRWKRSDAAREQGRRSSGDWWAMYCTRIQLNRGAIHLLDAIISQVDNRNHLAIQLANDYGYDVWEALSEEATRVQFSDIDDPAYNVVPVAGLTRQYWAREVLGVIARRRAINIWLSLNNPADDVSFEQGFAALSSFFGTDIERIFEELDRLALDCREYLRAQGFSENSDTTGTIIEICAWMRQRGFSSTEPPNHHDLLNNFPHSVLFDQHTSRPLVAVYIFVCVARRLGLDARPVLFLHIDLAIVSPATDAIYVNVFMSATHPILSYSDLPAMLQMMGLHPTDAVEFATPANAETVLSQAFVSVFHSIGRAVSQREINGVTAYYTAHYAAWSAALLLSGAAGILPKFLWGKDIRGPLDLDAVIRSTLRPALAEHSRNELDLRLAQLEKASPSDLNIPKTAGRIEHFTGMPIRIHGKFFGVIRGWDYEFRDKEIEQLYSDELSSGSNHACYHILTHDGYPRCVPGTNIEPVDRPKACDIVLLIEANKHFGRWFDGVEFTESGAARFIMSAESRALYPEDDMIGRVFFGSITTL